MRLIDADLFEVYAYKTPPEYDEESYDAGVGKVIDDIDAAPTIEAEPVRHGRWFRVDIAGEDPCGCSYCGDRVSVWGYRYCPNCGAKMDLE